MFEACTASLVRKEAVNVPDQVKWLFTGFTNSFSCQCYCRLLKMFRIWDFRKLWKLAITISDLTASLTRAPFDLFVNFVFTQVAINNRKQPTANWTLLEKQNKTKLLIILKIKNNLFKTKITIKWKMGMQIVE